MKKFMLYIRGAIISLVLTVLVIGLILPKEKVFAKERTIHASAGNVFSVITNFAEQMQWRKDIKEIKVLSQDSWTEVPIKGTPITFKVADRRENELFRIEIVAPESLNRLLDRRV